MTVTKLNKINKNPDQRSPTSGASHSVLKNKFLNCVLQLGGKVH